LSLDQMRMFQTQMRHATSGNALSYLKGVNQNDKFDVWIEALHMGAVTVKG